MPEPFTDEGTENLERYFCLLQNRCSRCINAAAAAAAGAARVTLQIRRCPGDGSLASTFHAADLDTKTSHDESKSSSASSSERLQATPSHETDGEEPLLVDNLAHMSLTDSHAKRVDVGEKRKAVVEPESQAKHQKKQFDSEFEFSGHAVQEHLQNKPQRMFQDANRGNEPIVCWRFPKAWCARPACASLVAGCIVSTEAEGQGSLVSCFDDIHTPECAVFPGPDEMDCEEP